MPHRGGASAMTIERCSALCGAAFKYFALQDGGNGCFCGASYGRYGRSSNCTMPCAGNRSETCGGAGCNSVFLQPPNLSVG